MAIHLLGIRHHGPGSARNVRTFLQSVKPDIVLVEGPPEADSLLKWVGHAGLKPPVAMLCYQPEDPQRSVFYPFAEFSPEWQAILYAQTQHIPVRFMDLPISNQFGLEKEAAAAAAPSDPSDPSDPADPDNPSAPTDSSKPGNPSDSSYPQDPLNPVNPLNPLDALNPSDPSTPPETSPDVPETLSEESKVSRIRDGSPMSWLAKAAGSGDEEKWWEHMFENRAGEEPVFDAVQEAMQALREGFPDRNNRRENCREAYMRQSIRTAEKEMFGSIAVICGAWHVPALTDLSRRKEDGELLKGLPKVKTECTWIPWTYQRLSYTSGYGAGIFSPGWYDHIWNYPKDDGTRWLSTVAALFRENQMDVSSAHVMEAVRLAASLASLRHLPRPGLEELNEATLSVFCQGEDIRMTLIRERLIVSDRIGEVPAETPKPPLQVDIEKLQKRLRLPPTADWKDYTLDLRKDTDLERSVLLHRLLLLNIGWGTLSEASGKGTFKEQWRLQWDPAFSIDIIEKGSYGNTVEEATSSFVIKKCREAKSLREVAGLLANTLPAELPRATEALIHQINDLSAASGDVIQLMEVVPGLVTVSRYGNVRKTDAQQVVDILESMITRICISLPAASTAVDEEAATELLGLFAKMNDSINIMQDEAALAQWLTALQTIAGITASSAAGSSAKGSTSSATGAGSSAAPLIAGYTTRLLADHKILHGESLVRTFFLAMSRAAAPATAAAWVEGFLKGSGSFLLVDNNLWDVVYGWVGQLEADSFTEILPLLRRSFAHFTQPERKKLGEKVKTGNKGTTITVSESGFDHQRARKAIPVVLQLLGLRSKNESPTSSEIAAPAAQTPTTHEQ